MVNVDVSLRQWLEQVSGEARGEDFLTYDLVREIVPEERLDNFYEEALRVLRSNSWIKLGGGDDAVERMREVFCLQGGEKVRFSPFGRQLSSRDEGLVRGGVYEVKDARICVVTGYLCVNILKSRKKSRCFSCGMNCGNLFLF